MGACIFPLGEIATSPNMRVKGWHKLHVDKAASVYPNEHYWGRSKSFGSIESLFDYEDYEYSSEASDDDEDLFSAIQPPPQVFLDHTGHPGEDDSEEDLDEFDDVYNF